MKERDALLKRLSDGLDKETISELQNNIIKIRRFFNE